ncbi:MAG: phosphate signaling complex protein PhoU [Candidatus Omnitrophica bacterium]|nr:phosphate signaling complex protein PhoU [Candidatus Omnitrophota bacterium]
MLEQRLLELSKHIVEFSALVEGMLSRSITGLQTRDRSILETVTGPDEDKANQIEIEIDEAVTVTIAQFQPKAKELRTALMILKMNNDLERMADHAVNIAESAFYLIQRPPVKPLLDIPRLAEIASRMLKESMLSFVNQDVNLAQTVCERDQIVDELRNQIWRELITFMTGDPNTIERSLHLLRIATNLERIADLATNISEDVIFMAQGLVIKHHQGQREK